MVFQCVPMDRVASAVMSVPIRMSGASLCLLDASDQLPRPSVASLAPNLTPGPSLTPTVAVSLVSNTVETCVWLLNSGTLTFQSGWVLPQVCEYSDHDLDLYSRSVADILYMCNSLGAASYHLAPFLRLCIKHFQYIAFCDKFAVGRPK